MICLAVNTANIVMSVAIVKSDGKILYSFDTSETRDQGNLLLQHIEKGLAQCGLKYEDLDLLAAVTGPGSFTGIRIGLAAMRGLALASQKPLIGISSFELYDDHMDGRDTIIAIESWREELYLKNGSHPALNVAPDDFMKTLDAGASYFITGDAAEKLRDILPDAVFSDETGHAVKAAKLAMTQFSHTKKGEKPEPYYLRDADVSVSTKIRPTTIV